MNNLCKDGVATPFHGVYARKQITANGKPVYESTDLDNYASLVWSGAS